LQLGQHAAVGLLLLVSPLGAYQYWTMCLVAMEVGRNE